MNAPGGSLLAVSFAPSCGPSPPRGWHAVGVPGLGGSAPHGGGRDPEGRRRWASPPPAVAGESAES